MEMDQISCVQGTCRKLEYFLGIGRKQEDEAKLREERRVPMGYVFSINRD